MHIRRGTLPGHFRKVFEEHTSSDVLDKITLANNADTFTTNTVVREHAELGLWSLGVHVRHWTSGLQEENKTDSGGVLPE